MLRDPALDSKNCYVLQLHVHSQLQLNHSCIVYSVLVATIDGLSRVANPLRPP